MEPIGLTEKRAFPLVNCSTIEEETQARMLLYGDYAFASNDMMLLTTSHKHDTR